MKFDEVVLGRRSCRGYKQEPVPRALIGHGNITLRGGIPASHGILSRRAAKRRATKLLPKRRKTKGKSMQG